MTLMQKSLVHNQLCYIRRLQIANTQKSALSFVTHPSYTAHGAFSIRKGSEQSLKVTQFLLAIEPLRV
jgi:hypothetical protein